VGSWRFGIHAHCASFVYSLHQPSASEDLLESEQAKVGAEVGVQRGIFSKDLLSVWTSAEKWYMVDLWAHQPNYDDVANVDDGKQDNIYKEALENVGAWQDKTVILRDYSTVAAEQIPDESLDFAYLDARHDYCGVTEDLTAYWRKVRPGGILAGHDFLTAEEVKHTGQDWSLCLNGTRNDGAVKGAVLEWAVQHCLTIVVTQDGWPSWVVRKPCSTQQACS